MELFWQSAALAMVAVILGLVLNGQHGGIGNFLSLTACCLILSAMVRYLEPVLELLERLRELAGISQQMISIVLKSTAVGLISEVAVLICTDAGSASLGKAIQILSNGVILWLSLPLFEQVVELLQEVLGRV